MHYTPLKKLIIRFVKDTIRDRKTVVKEAEAVGDKNVTGKVPLEITGGIAACCENPMLHPLRDRGVKLF